MDPNANLERQLEIAREIAERGTVLERRETDKGVTWSLADLADELAELVLALDEWRTHGGFDPYTDKRQNYLHELRRDIDLFVADAPSPGEMTDEHAARLVQFARVANGLLDHASDERFKLHVRLERARIRTLLGADA